MNFLSKSWQCMLPQTPASTLPIERIWLFITGWKHGSEKPLNHSHNLKLQKNLLLFMKRCKFVFCESRVVRKCFRRKSEHSCSDSIKWVAKSCVSGENPMNEKSGKTRRTEEEGNFLYVHSISQTSSNVHICGLCKRQEQQQEKQEDLSLKPFYWIIIVFRWTQKVKYKQIQT